MPPENNIFNLNIGLLPWVEASNQMAQLANEYANNLRRLYPELSNLSLENLLKFHESGLPMSFNGKVITPITYNPVKASFSLDTKTLHELGKKAAKAIRDTNQAMEKAQTSIVSVLPFAYPLLAAGANLHLNRYGIKNQYLPEAAISTGLEFTLPFIPEFLKRGFNWGTRNIGTKASRLAATMNLNISILPTAFNQVSNKQISMVLTPEYFDPKNFTTIESILAKNLHIEEGKKIIGKYGKPELETIAFLNGKYYPAVITYLDSNSPLILPARSYFKNLIEPRFKNFGITIQDPFEDSAIIYAHKMPRYKVVDNIAVPDNPPMQIGGGAGDNFALVYDSAPDIQSGWIHEVDSHLTDKYIPKIISDEYLLITTIPDKLKQRGFTFTNPDSGMWEEARATINEVRNKMLNDGINLNTVSDDTILEYLQDVNSYGHDYTRLANHLLGEEKSKYINRIRNALITLPIMTGLFSIPKTEQFKRGGHLIPKVKSGIHIKKKNRGKFTKSAKQAGLSVLEHAKSVLNNPNATPLQKKRANFARNAAKWHKK